MCEEEKQLIIFQDRFSNLLEENIEAIKDERKLRGLISDYFPKEKWLNHLLISLYKDGIVEEIEKCESVEFESFLRFKKDLISNYRTQEQEAEWAVNIWFESYGNYILKKDNNVRKYVHRNTAINSKEANELVEKIIQISQNMHYTENALQDILTIFQNASQYPNVLGKLYMLYPVLKQYYDTEETEYSYIMYYAIYNEKSICEYEDYMNLYNTLLSMKCNVDYYIYGIFLLKGAHSKDGVVSVKLNEEKGYKWCAYFFEKLKKMNNITKTRGLYFHIENLEFALGVAYLQGKYVKKDIKKATMCWKSMLKRNVNEYSDIEDAKKVLRCVGGAYIGKSVTVSVNGIKEYEIKVQKNLKLGYKFLEKASEYGDAFSLFCLAEMYEKGEYVKKDFFHAVQLYEQAEENGEDEAATWIKENKTVVELIDEVVEISKATEYNDELWCRIYKIFEEAPQFPEVLRCLYLLYPVIKNYDTEENCYSRNIFMLLFKKDSLCGYEDYFVLFNKMADLRWDGDYYLYGILLTGAEVEWGERVIELDHNLENAIKWFVYFDKLINYGNISCVRFLIGEEEEIKFYLGCAYIQGLYIEKNTQKGYRYWKELLAIENNKWGDSERAGKMLLTIGKMYLGEICHFKMSNDEIYDFKIRKNRKEGLKYLYKASELGNIKAILLLAEMYEQGNYVNRDVGKAYQLYKKAEAKGDESAREKIADLRSMLELEEVSCSRKEKLIDIEDHKDEFIQLDENEYELVDVGETEDEWSGDELVEIDETEDFDED